MILVFKAFIYQTGVQSKMQSHVRPRRPRRPLVQPPINDVVSREPTDFYHRWFSFITPAFDAAVNGFIWEPMGHSWHA